MAERGAVVSGAFRTHVSRPGADTVLFCFPHAGGAASFFGPWAEEAPAHVEVHAAQYPGREDRFGAPPVAGIGQLADILADEVGQVRGRRVILFGHSMGALVAYEVARRLEAVDAPVSRLVVSAMGAPHKVAGTFARLDGLPSAMAELRRLGGTDNAILGAPGFLEFLAPTFKADSDLVAEYRHAHDGRLDSTPVDVYLGEFDPGLRRSEIEYWAELATSVKITIFTGDHFYLTPQRAEVIASALRPAVV
ncbi:thioesterase II family protein [Kitasatospora purpeofusca]|uniref:thioesterase II family protein n=1 Tax=Kitasatospora purpeofusca TaxID=67352 RepID=UPI0036C71AB4